MIMKSKKAIEGATSRRDRLFRKAVDRTSAKPDVSFVQVVANDGNGTDPLPTPVTRRSRSRIMVEPVPRLFERPEASHGSRSHLSFRDVMISSEGGRRKSCNLEEHGDQEDRASGNGLESLDLDHALHLRDQIPDFADNPLEFDVGTVAFPEFVEGVRHIDTKGCDFEVIKTIDFEAVSPSIIPCASACLNRFSDDVNAKRTAGIPPRPRSRMLRVRPHPRHPGRAPARRGAPAPASHLPRSLPFRRHHGLDSSGKTCRRSEHPRILNTRPAACGPVILDWTDTP